jgi:hypothetical protein
VGGAEQRRDDVTGADVAKRTRAQRGHRRVLATVFGEITVTRMAYRAPGAVNLQPTDAGLNMPGEKHSHELGGWRLASPCAGRLTPPESDRGRHRHSPGTTAGRAARPGSAAGVDALCAAPPSRPASGHRSAGATGRWQGHRNAGSLGSVERQVMQWWRLGRPR